MRSLRVSAVVPVVLAALVGVWQPRAAHAVTPNWDVLGDQSYCVGFNVYSCTPGSGSTTAFTTTAEIGTRYGNRGSVFTPDAVYVGCDRYYTDSVGVRHHEHGTIRIDPWLGLTGTISGFVSVGSTPTETNTNIHAYWSVKATDAAGDIATVNGSQWYDNQADFILSGTLSVRYSGKMQKWHYAGGIAVSDGQGNGTVACTAQALATQYQEGEAEVE